MDLSVNVQKILIPKYKRVQVLSLSNEQCVHKGTLPFLKGLYAAKDIRLIHSIEKASILGKRILVVTKSNCKYIKDWKIFTL